MKQISLLIFISCLLLFIQACKPQDSHIDKQHDFRNSQEVNTREVDELIPEERTVLEKDHRDEIDLSLFNRQPVEWGENVTGVKTTFQTDNKEIALTFDACGGDYGSDFDQELIDFLNKEDIPATLFINEGWIDMNGALFLDLAANPLFQIENHGTCHAPLSVNGGEAWGIEATESVESAFDEIMNNHKTVEELTGNEMTLFRSGTAYYDEVAVELAEALGYKVVNFDILGDAGATYSATEVKDALMQANPGSIALLHMNQPTSATAEGVKMAIPLLREKGFEFVHLTNKTLQ